MTKNTLLFAFLLLCIDLSAQTICVDNIAKNPSFESDLTDWTNLFNYSQVTNTQVNSGSIALQMCKDRTARLFQTISITPQKSYIFTVYGFKTGNVPTNIYLKFSDATFQAIAAGYTQITSSSYQTFTIAATAPLAAKYLEYGFLKDEGVGCLYADDVCLTVSDVLISNKEQDIAQDFELFPVPTEDFVWLSLGDLLKIKKGAKALVVNQLGQVVKQFSLENSQNNLTQLDLSDVAKGVYFLKIEANGVGFKVRKLVVN
jgi:Secretion system C-terminal sorting domain